MGFPPEVVCRLQASLLECRRLMHVVRSASTPMVRDQVVNETQLTDHSERMNGYISPNLFGCAFMTKNERKP
jgi:hypothetical protein